MPYRFFSDAGHGWLEVPREEVEASGAKVSAYSYYDPDTDMVYLEEDRDAWTFLDATKQDGHGGESIYLSDSWIRGLEPYEHGRFGD